MVSCQAKILALTLLLENSVFALYLWQVTLKGIVLQIRAKPGIVFPTFLCITLFL